MISYLHQYILYYTVIIRPLQKRKTQLNHCLQKLWVKRRLNDEKISNIKDNICKLMISRTVIEKLTLSELDSFHQLQSLFFKSIILIHYDLKCQLYADINTSKEFSFEAHIYHMKKSHSFIFSQKSMKSILFLNKTLANTETQYWLTELEVIDLIWLVQKIHHMLKSAENSTIVYTDYFITLNIVCQFSWISTTLIDKINLQLVCISEYLQRFCLNVWHKADKINIVSDTLFWLASTSMSDSLNQSLNSLTVNTLMIDIWIQLVNWTAQLKSLKDIFKNSLLTEYISVYSAILVKMNEVFWIKLLKVYNTESQWDHIWTMISENDTLRENAAKFPYCLIWKLIYFDNSEHSLCLCISYDLIKKVFQLTHDKLEHSDYVYTHKCLMQDLYIHNLLKQLHKFIRYCS